MPFFKKTLLIAVCSWLLVIGSLAEKSQAGWLSDWLSRQACRARMFTYPSWLSLRPPMGDQSCSKPTTCYRYVTETAYRTCWKQIPVTYYRPSTSIDPTTGCPVYCMRPCQAVRWQAYRVPYTTYRPVQYTCQTVCQPVNPSGVTGLTVQNPSTGCSSCGQTTFAAPPVPSLSTPVVPRIQSPPANSNEPTWQPSESSDSQLQTVPQDQSPASQPPSLSPNTSSQNLSAPSYKPSSSDHQDVDPQPIQDLDGQEEDSETSAPNLLNSDSNHTAQRPLRRVATAIPIQWSSSKATPIAANLPIKQKQLNESGWQSVER